MTEGSLWFRRLVKDCAKISSHIRVKRIKYGFYRIYWKTLYVHEIYKEMPQKGYDIEDNDIRLISQKYYEDYEDRAELTRKIKNYVEGYWDSLDRVKTRIYMIKNNKTYSEQAKQMYGNTVIK